MISGLAFASLYVRFAAAYGVPAASSSAKPARACSASGWACSDKWLDRTEQLEQIGQLGLDVGEGTAVRQPRGSARVGADPELGPRLGAGAGSPSSAGISVRDPQE